MPAPEPCPSAAVSVTFTAPSCQPSSPSGESGLISALLAGAFVSSLIVTGLKPSALPARSIARYSSVCSPSVENSNGVPYACAAPPSTR